MPVPPLLPTLRPGLLGGSTDSAAAAAAATTMRNKNRSFRNGNANGAGNRTAICFLLLRWLAVLVFVYGILRWMDVFGPLSDTAAAATENVVPEIKVYEGEGGGGGGDAAVPATKKPPQSDTDTATGTTAAAAAVLGTDGSKEHGVPPPPPHPAGVRKHTDRVAVIVEDRPLGNLIPVILHFHAVLGPEWPIILYTSPSTHQILSESSVAFTRATTAATANGAASTTSQKQSIILEVRHLPANTSFATHASVSEFLTSPYLWTDLAPYVKILLFQADSMICGSAPRHADDFLTYDLIGAPIDARYGVGFNGGLSLRNRELILRVLDRWDFSSADTGTEEGGGGGGGGGFEDQWFYTKMRALADDAEIAGELGVVVELPDPETAATFAAETLWVPGARPLGFHQPQRWQRENMKEIMEYCPEVGMIADSTFFG